MKVWSLDVRKTTVFKDSFFSHLHSASVTRLIFIFPNIILFFNAMLAFLCAHLMLTSNCIFASNSPFVEILLLVVVYAYV